MDHEDQKSARIEEDKEGKSTDCTLALNVGRIPHILLRVLNPARVGLWQKTRVPPQFRFNSYHQVLP